MKFRKKPVVIEAVQWNGTEESFDKIMELSKPASREILRRKGENENGLVIPTLEGNMEASIGDWIIKGISGEIYPCKPDIFLKTYDKV